MKSEDVDEICRFRRNLKIQTKSEDSDEILKLLSVTFEQAQNAFSPSCFALHRAAHKYSHLNIFVAHFLIGRSR